MSSSRLAKLRKQPDSTWVLLQKRLIGLPDWFEKLFLPNVWNFIINKSHSLSTNPGYVSTSLITTTSFIAGSASTLVTTTHEMLLNIYSIFVGPPTTGKSQAIKECAVSPMTAVVTETDSSSPVIQKCTSSGLIKTIAENKKGFLFKNELGSGASFSPRRLLGSLLGTELVVCKRNEANLNCLHRYSATYC